MQDIYEVLREKEIAVERLRREVEALRLACPLLLEQDDSLRIILSADVEPQQVDIVAVQPSDESANSLAAIREQLVGVPRSTFAEETEKHVLLKFGQAALDASRMLLKRVRNVQWMDPEFQRKTVA